MAASFTWFSCLIFFYITFSTAFWDYFLFHFTPNYNNCIFWIAYFDVLIFLHSVKGTKKSWCLLNHPGKEISKSWYVQMNRIIFLGCTGIFFRTVHFLNYIRIFLHLQNLYCHIQIVVRYSRLFLLHPKLGQCHTDKRNPKVTQTKLQKSFVENRLLWYSSKIEGTLD